MSDQDVSKRSKVTTVADVKEDTSKVIYKNGVSFSAFVYIKDH